MAAPANATSRAPKCDCCGQAAWEYLFTLSGVDLGRSAECGLHYVAQMPARSQGGPEVEEEIVGENHQVTSAEVQHQFERQSVARFSRYVELVGRFAPPGKWLDVGCGTGTLIRLALERGVEIEGIELGHDRLELARKLTGVPIHDRPVEELPLDAGSLAAVIMIDVFSHLTSPKETLGAIQEALQPGGVLLLHTSEIGRGAKPHHQPAWGLGEHLFFLGEGTIERYAADLGSVVVHRERVWLPETVFTRDRFRMRGRSRMRDLAKRIVLHTPGVFRLLRWYMIRHRQADNPLYASTIVMRKPG